MSTESMTAGPGSAEGGNDARTIYCRQEKRLQNEYGNGWRGNKRVI